MTFPLTIVILFIINFYLVVQYQKEDFIGCFSRSDPDTFGMRKVSWFWNILCPVFSLSNMQNISEKSLTHRKNNIPNVVHVHNKHIGGGDLHDTKQLGCFFFWMWKHYLRLMFHLINIYMVNFWLQTTKK